MDIKGKIHEIGATQQVTDTVKKRELIIEYIENPQYPEYIKFEAIQAKCDLLDQLRVGDDVEVFFNLKGRPWTDKNGKKSYFNSLWLWKVNTLSKAENTVGNLAIQSPGAPDEDDLPF